MGCISQLWLLFGFFINNLNNAYGPNSSSWFLPIPFWASRDQYLRFIGLLHQQIKWATFARQNKLFKDCAPQAPLNQNTCRGPDHLIISYEKRGWEKSSTLLLVKHFEITINNCVARLSAAVLTNFRQSCYLALTTHVDRPSLVSLLSPQQLR